MPYLKMEHTKSMYRLVQAILVACGLAATLNAASTDNSTFDWYSLNPSDTLNWTSCYDGHKCARLNLPLDYLTPNDTRKTAIALHLLPAKDQANSKGTIFINPGGPGVSGTDFIAIGGGALIASIVGDAFDILGFDPRGIGASTPRASCYDCDAERQPFAFGSGESFLSLKDGSIPLTRARENLTAQRCDEKIGGPDGIARFMGTTSVARDMLEINKQLGQDKLLYWGFSYGTILGQYFAAMYPEHVGRLIIDGVWDGHDYRDALFNSSLTDADKVLNSFYQFCFEGGPDKCPTYAPSPQQIEARFKGALAQLEEQPIPLPLASIGPALVTAKDLQAFMFQAFYGPIAEFGNVANAIVAIEARNATALAAIPGFVAPLNCACARPQSWAVTGPEAKVAVTCGDAAPIADTPDEYAAYFRGIAARSALGASIGGINRLQCSQWRVRAAWRFDGALGAEKTAAPMLVLSPRFDPLTPLDDARKVAARYGGARVLVQDSYGHSSLAAPSACTAGHVRAYFENGTLPEEGAVCEADALPFIGLRSGAKAGPVARDVYLGRRSF